jgi:hypothetical protein
MYEVLQALVNIYLQSCTHYGLAVRILKLLVMFSFHTMNKDLVYSISNLPNVVLQAFLSDDEPLMTIAIAFYAFTFGQTSKGMSLLGIPIDVHGALVSRTVDCSLGKLGEEVRPLDVSSNEEDVYD